MGYVLLVGDLTTGYSAVGPFGNYTLAYEYAQRHVADQTKWFIFKLYAPVDA